MKAHSIPVVSEQRLIQMSAAMSRKLLAVLTIGLGLTLAVVWLLGGGAPLALAANTTVNTTADELNSDGDCSLREAIQAANLGATVSGCLSDAGPDTINLPAGIYTLTLTGVGEEANAIGDLDITSAQAITIVGVGAAQTIINANGIDRVLDIQPGAGTVVISGVTIFNGNPGDYDGGGIRDADADLVLINTIVLSSTAAVGGGVCVWSGSATLSGGQIARNTATQAGGGVYVVGATTAFTQTGASTIALNTAGNSCGGVSIGAGTATLSGGQIVSNTAADGGGVCVWSGSATLSGGQIRGNTATVGGGVYIVWGTAAFTQAGASIIAGNTATYGGGVWVGSGRATLSGGQIVSNTATDRGGGVFVGATTAAFTQTGASTIAGNTANSGGGVYINAGRATLSGGQIVSNIAPLGGGVYVDRGTAAFAQTGVSTITLNIAAVGGGVYVYSGTATLSGGQIVSNTGSQAGGGVYVAGGAAAFTQTGASTIAGNTTTYGGGVYVDLGSATLSGGQIRRNTATNYGGGVYVESGSVTLSGEQIVSNTAAVGGGVWIGSGRATLSGGQIVSNTATDRGGGVFVGATTAAFTQTGGSAIVGNIANSGGGVFVGYGRATLSGGQIVRNTATQAGGGVYLSGPTAAFAQTGASTIALNTAGNAGGGMCIETGTATVSGGQIVSNTATYGGGVFNTSGMLALVNSTVSGNRATSGSGGGLFNNNGSTSVLTFTTVASNTATSGGGGIHREGGTVLLQDTIVAYNGTNCNAALTSNGHNLEYGHSCGLTATGDMTDTNPLLGPLTAYGGSLVHPLLTGSPAIDHGVCIAGITTDQRGATRPYGAACDIGAYEYVPPVYLPLVLRNF